MFGIPSQGWVSLGIWGLVIIIPWVYSAFLIFKINQSGVERWGAKPSKARPYGQREGGGVS